MGKTENKQSQGESAPMMPQRNGKFWRSLDQLANTEAYQRSVDDEFPDREGLLNLDRRQFVGLLGASTLMASLVGCRRLPQEKIIPYVKTPEGSVSGINQYYATSVSLGGFAHGILAESRSGRPGKLEGHPGHPSTLGSSDPFIQGSLYDMYDPDRSKSVYHNGQLSSWTEFAKAIAKALAEVESSHVVLLTEQTTSPTELAMIQKFISKHQGASWFQWDPVNKDNELEGLKAAFGQAVTPVYDYTKAKVILSLDDDFMTFGPGRVRYTRDFSAGRIVDSKDPVMNRLYAIYSASSTTSAAADHGLGVKPSQVHELAAKIAAVVQGTAATGDHAEWINAVGADLKAAGAGALVTAGAHQPASVHAIAHGLNALLGAVNSTVKYLPRLGGGAESMSGSLNDLMVAIKAQAVDLLIILGGNPVYNAPGDSGFAEAVSSIKSVVHHGIWRDETGHAAGWHTPEAHYLECWGDGVAYDGTPTLQQPLIAPLYVGKSKIEFLDILCGGARSGLDIMKEEVYKGYETKPGAWDKFVHDGMRQVEVAPVAVNQLATAFSTTSQIKGGELEIVILPDPTVYDGRFANNAWMQELPKPMTSLTWDNAVQLSPKTAAKFGVIDQDIVEVAANNSRVQGPVKIVPGQADDTVVVHMGYGRTKGGTICTATSGTMPVTNTMGGKGVGFNAFPLLSMKGAIGEATITKVGGQWILASVQTHHSMEGRDIVRSASLEDYKKDPSMHPHGVHHHESSLYNYTEEFSEGQQRWAMTIDLSLCTGCNACTIACQAENNIPAVGKEQVQRGREMHWIRIDRYYVGEPEHPTETVFQPVACMHCEIAPCEPVCPVAATVHSREGLNQMVYNRCVGTRYCSNNCPYKVRRFNYINFNDKVDKPSITLLNNPDVTVRGRGVMEKCTFCVQRINKARIQGKKSGEGKVPTDGVVTACQQACPTNAIVFGDWADPKSAITKSKANPRNYDLLPEVNTKPRTSYLGRVRNINPALAGPAKESHEGEAH